MRLRLAVGLCGVLLLVGCSSASRNNQGSPDGASATAAARGYKIGKPYSIKGVWYYPHVDYDYVEEGVASWYGPGFHGKSTANGETYDMNELTAAHRTLPMPSIVRVTNLENGRSIQLKVNDRGPFARDRIIDVSRRASQLLGFQKQGTSPVRVEILEEESRMLAAALGVPSEVAWAAARSAPPPLAPAPEPVLVAELPPPPSEAPAAHEQMSAVVTPTTEPSPDEVGYAQSYAAAASYAPPPAGYQPSEAATPDPVEIVETTASVASGDGGAARWIQAGAFADPSRAAAARRRLAGLGPTVTSPSFVDGRELLRVRIGPFSSQQEAQRILASVTEAGFQGSRIVAD